MQTQSFHGDLVKRVVRLNRFDVAAYARKVAQLPEGFDCTDVDFGVEDEDGDCVEITFERITLVLDADKEKQDG